MSRSDQLNFIFTDLAQNSFDDLLKERQRCYDKNRPPRERPPRERPPRELTPEGRASKSAARKAKSPMYSLDRIAIFDTETDPFDNTSGFVIRPFLGVLYTNQQDPIVIWENDFDVFTHRFETALQQLSPPHTIYAHNGGKFDYKFFLRRLRGRVRTKGGALMEFDYCGHRLRDSLHIIPVALALYNKQKFDYEKLRAERRDLYRDEIIQYCISDCENQYAIVREFVERHGFKLSIGQAALTELRKSYTVKKIGPHEDAVLRQFYYGGRVEHFQPVGEYHGNYTLYDVNSMYPFAMARFDHPVGPISRCGRKITENTVFIHLRCKNRGALAARGDHGLIDCNIVTGEFFSTIHEYRAACELGLLSNVEILQTYDFVERTNFANFILPAYARRAELKLKIDAFKNADPPLDLTREALLIKLLLNNSYGKFAQNPARYRETFITNPEEYPNGPGSDGPLWGKPSPDGTASRIPDVAEDNYWIWKRRPERLTYHNVATAASITGAARSLLLRAIHACEDPLYCDTDSLICTRLGDNVRIDAAELGAWKPERRIDIVRIAGKKQYGYRWVQDDPAAEPKYTVRCKGSRLTWNELGRIVGGETVSTIATGVTIGMDGSQCYTRRDIKATGWRRWV